MLSQKVQHKFNLNKILHLLLFPLLFRASILKWLSPKSKKENKKKLNFDFKHLIFPRGGSIYKDTLIGFGMHIDEDKVVIIVRYKNNTLRSQITILPSIPAEAIFDAPLPSEA